MNTNKSKLALQALGDAINPQAKTVTVVEYLKQCHKQNELSIKMDRLEYMSRWLVMVLTISAVCHVGVLLFILYVLGGV